MTFACSIKKYPPSQSGKESLLSVAVSSNAEVVPCSANVCLSGNVAGSSSPAGSEHPYETSADVIATPGYASYLTTSLFLFNRTCVVPTSNPQAPPVPGSVQVPLAESLNAVADATRKPPLLPGWMGPTLRDHEGREEGLKGAR
jgi:hypothetical protein